MPTDMFVALIAAGASIICAIVSIFASRDAQTASVKAQETSKRMEQLRLQATKVGQNLIDILTSMIMDSEQVLYELRLKGEPIATDDEEGVKAFIKLAEPIGKQIPKLRKLLYSSAMYTSPEITQSIEEVLKLMQGGPIPLEENTWEEFINKLHKEHHSLAKFFQDKYLKEDSF